MCKLYVFSIGPRRSIETNISKKAIFPVRIVFRLFILVFSKIPSLKKHFSSVQMYFDKNSGSCEIVSVTPTRLSKSKILEKRLSFQ